MFEPFLVGKNLLRHIRVHVHYHGESLLVNLELHDLGDLRDCLSDAEHLPQKLEFVILNATHVKGVLYHILQVECRI